jgi:hypothetical protein
MSAFGGKAGLTICENPLSRALSGAIIGSCAAHCSPAFDAYALAVDAANFHRFPNERLFSSVVGLLKNDQQTPL